MSSWLYVGLFGLAGIFARYGIDQWGAEKNQNFPLTTLTINLLGCAIAGLVYVLAEKNSWSDPLRIGLLVGFCGGFTTFSAYALRTFLMIEEGRFVPAFTYWVLSPILGLFVIAVTVKITRIII